MNDPQARFRIRNPEGVEIPVGSVEELSRRVETGEVHAETPLFDSGVGSWGRAGDASIFQFIVEELRAEGRLPEEPVFEDADRVLPPDPEDVSPVEVPEDFEPIRHLEGESEGATAAGVEPAGGEDTEGPAPFIPLAPPTVDPFEMHLPLGEPDPWPSLEDAEPAGEVPVPEGIGDTRSAQEPGPEPEADPDPEPGVEAEAGPGPGGGPGPGIDPAPPGSAGGTDDAPPAPPSGPPGEREAGSEPLREPWFEDRPWQAPADADEAPPPPEALRGEAPPTSDPPGPAVDDRGGVEASSDQPPDAQGGLADWITHGPPAPLVPEPPASGAADEEDPPRPRPRQAMHRDPGVDDPPATPPPGLATSSSDTLAGPRKGGGRKGGGRSSGDAPAEDDPWRTERSGPLFTAPEEGEEEPGREGDTGPDTPPEPLEIRTAWEDQVDAVDPRTQRLVARRRRRNLRILAGVAGVAVLLMGGRVLVEAFRSPAQPSDATTFPTPVTGGVQSPGGAPSLEVPPLDPTQVPAGLEEVAEALWDGIPAQLALAVEGLREEAGLEDAPPREWLGGFYLANADEFDGVPLWWEGYLGFVHELRARDEVLVVGAAEEVLDAYGVAAPDRARLLQMVRTRHAEVAPAREDRYLHLARTAEAALAFHDFLVLNTGAIRFAPALGGGVSADPVLEAITETPAIRRELEGHLDRIFQALDRTRAGGQPSPAGLRAELFGGFGYPL